jgi:hypothetical protein
MNLREKLATIRKELHNIKKSGRNDFHKYDYVTGADTAGMIGNRLAELNVMPASRNLVVGHYTVESAKGPKSITTLQLEYGFLDGESDEQLWYAAYGEGEDATDKGAYKAWTGAQKYWLIQAFMLAMGDDPEFEKQGKQNEIVHEAAAVLRGAEVSDSPMPADFTGKAIPRVTEAQIGMVKEQFAIAQNALGHDELEQKCCNVDRDMPRDMKWGPVETWAAIAFEKRYAQVIKWASRAMEAAMKKSESIEI